MIHAFASMTEVPRLPAFSGGLVDNSGESASKAALRRWSCGVIRCPFGSTAALFTSKVGGGTGGITVTKLITAPANDFMLNTKSNVFKRPPVHLFKTQ